MRTDKISFLEEDAKPSGLTLPRPDVKRAPEVHEECTILLADASAARRRSIVSALDCLGHNVVEARTGAEAIREISERPVDAVIVDLFIPELGAIDFCRTMKADEHARTTPVLVLSRADDVDSEVLAMEAGADGFLVAPLQPRALRARVGAALRQKAMLDSLDETEKVLFTLAQSVEERDSSLGQHCERMSLMAAAMGVRLGLPSADILALQRGGYLHDVGKVAIPDSVLLKPGPLTSQEWKVMKSHVEKGERICSNLRSLAPVLPIIRHHHERWDGSGYPDGLQGRDIPLLARILQAADIYDALTEDRPYKRAFTSEEAIRIMRDETAKGWRDPDIIQVFEEILPTFRDAEEEDSSTSLAALAQSIENYRRRPARSCAGDRDTAETDARP